MSGDAQPPSEILTPGTTVRVRRAFPPGHTRTPWYVRGRAGVVERFVGRFPNPEALGYGLGPTPRVALYRVRFAMADIWEDYAGPSGDSLDVEIYEHWLQC
ncbi:SH3-like domain-containing protein [Salinarimonas sp. NSM]|uniref:SH3-like domain-containing protein n=1 Tax=Salinarimonas sp. NSM TaxID=3458003 RepID=UPI00403536EF